MGWKSPGGGMLKAPSVLIIFQHKGRSILEALKERLFWPHFIAALDVLCVYPKLVFLSESKIGVFAISISNYISSSNDTYKEFLFASSEILG